MRAQNKLALLYNIMYISIGTQGILIKIVLNQERNNYFTQSKRSKV